MYSPDEVEALLLENEAEFGRSLGDRGKPKGGGGSGGKGGGGGEGGSGGKGGSDGEHGGGKTGSHDEHGGGKAAPKVAPKVDTETAEKKSVTLENESEALARELQTHPELEAFSGSKAKEFFAGVHAKYGSVRASAAGIIVLALNVSDAYALLKEVRSILDSKTLREGLERSFALGKNLAIGQIEFGVLRFVFRSTPVAIGIQVFLGNMDMNLSLGPNGKFDQEIAALVNKVRPGFGGTRVPPRQRHELQ